MSISEVVQLIVKDGLTTYKKVNSKASLPALYEATKWDKQNKKGAVFAVRNKSDLSSNGVRGYIITSKETLAEDANNISHWTPNVFRKFNYTNAKRTKIEGFEEQHLLQVNTFVVDIDTKDHSIQDIVLAAMDQSVGVPTLILETDRGYQVYFVLDKPIYISSERKFLSLEVAKRIATNIKKSLADVQADVFCNSFGFFRMPNERNIVWYRPENTYTAKELIDWSMRQDDDAGRQLFVVPSKRTASMSMFESEWFIQLINMSDVRGQKGQLGRNNLLFTLALTCLQDGRSEEYTFDFIDEMNIRLQQPLKGSEIRTIVKSAYSGKYNGPSKDYIEALLASYGSNDVEVKFNTNGWYKHKKERSERVRSHLSEWETDYVAYINANGPFIQMTQADLCKELNIPKSTLNKLVKESKVVMKKATKGRGASTIWTTSTAFIKHAIEVARSRKEEFALALRTIINMARLNEEYPAHAVVLKYAYELTREHDKTRSEQLSITRMIPG